MNDYGGMCNNANQITLKPIVNVKFKLVADKRIIMNYAK